VSNTENQELQTKLIQLISDQLNVDVTKIVPTSHFIKDLGADSLDTVELVMAIEETFELEIPDDMAEQIKTVEDAIRLVSEQQAA
jgi:acyl carrier protein